MRLSFVRLFSVVVLGFWLAAGELAAQLPASDGAPKVGETAPEFTLPDSEGNPESLASLLKERAEREAALGQAQYLLLVFYRGYW
jgi:hypothetical protein